MAERIEGAVQVTLHLEELQARQNPELVGRAEYRLRVWINGLERWQSEKPVKVAEGGTAAVGAIIPMRLEFDTDIIAIQAPTDERGTPCHCPAELVLEPVCCRGRGERADLGVG